MCCQLLDLQDIRKTRPYHLSIALVSAGITVWLLALLGGLRFDYDFEAFFPNEDSELEVYNRFRETFDHDNEFVLIAPVSSKGIFRKDFLLRTDSLANALSTLKHVKSVQSAGSLKRLMPGVLLPVAVPVLHIDDSTRYAADSARIYSEGLLVGSFFPKDGKSLTIVVKTDNGLSKTNCDSLGAAISRQVSRFAFEDVHMAGRIFAQRVFLDQITREFVVFICISFFVVVIFLWLTFRTIAGVLLPLTVVLASIVWTLGLMYLLGKPVDLLTTMLPTMVFIAGMSDVVHFISRHAEATEAGVPRDRILPLLLREVGLPTFVTLLTTVVAFLSLLFSSIQPVREFGVYTAAGITIAFILTYTLLPSLLYLFNPGNLIRPSKTHRFTDLMRSALFWIFRNQKLILSVTAAVLVLSIVGASRIKVNNRLLEDLNEKVRVKQDFLFFDDHYSGVRPLEIVLNVEEPGDAWSYRNIKTISRIDSFIRINYQPGFLVSPATLATEVYRARSGDTTLDFPTREEYSRIEPFLRSMKRNKDVKKFISSDARQARISGKIRDLGSSTVQELDSRLVEFMKNSPGNGSLKFSITGAAHLIDRNNEYMVENMTQGFLFSVITIALLTFILHRSWRMVLVFILPNLIPLMVIAGIMGFAGIELKAATSIIFSIAFGIATDDTIHFISRLKIERGYGKSLMYAFKRTYFETGKPIVLTTFILLGGFMSMMSSDFQSTFYFGFLTCITIVIALVADLFLLPVLLFVLYRNKSLK